MRNRILTLLTLLLCIGSIAHADLPFRNHRYDGFKVLKVNSESIVFIGNSITNMHEWWEAFDNPNIVNRGVSGAVSDEALANLESVLEGKPAKIFLMIGTNDLGTSGMDYPEYPFRNFKKMMERIKQESPTTEVYVQSVLPVSASDKRDHQEIKALNELMKSYCETHGITYVDLHSLMVTSGTTNINPNHTLDGLHLLASGYRVWCKAIAPYVGSECVYPDNANNQTAGLGGSYGMRASYFGMLPVREGDVLMIGDEMIHGGEWHELLSCARVKSRGSGWGFAGPDINTVKNQLSVILKGRSDNAEPEKIFLYTGAADACGSTDLATLQTRYRSLVDETRRLAPTATIYLQAILPTANSTTNTDRVVPLNTYFEELAAEMENVEYVDQYTPFVKGGVANSDYFSGNYLYGKGYAKLSQIIAPLIGDDATPISDDEATLRHTTFGLRTALMQAVVSAESIELGTKAGQYPAEAAGDLQSAIEAANSVLAKSGADEAEVENATAALSTALNKLLPSINQPTASTEDAATWYQVVATLRGNRYLTSSGSGQGLTGEEQNNLAKSMWRFEKRTDGTWNIINRKDGSYISPTASYNTQVKTSAKAPSKGWTLDYASTPGLYIIKSGTVQLNQTQAGLSYQIYNWSAGQSGTDRTDSGCQFALIETTEEPEAEPDPLETGWYTFMVASGDATMNGYIAAGTHHILNAEREYRQTAANYYPLRIGAPDAERPALGWVYLTSGNGKFRVQALNGHTLNENCTSSRSLTHTPTGITPKGGTEVSIDKWSCYSPADGTEAPYVGKMSNSNNTFNYSRVSEEALAALDHYVVEITGAANASEIGNDATLTCLRDDCAGIPRVFNNGHLFFPAGTPISATDFTASEQADLYPSIAIEKGKIKLTYSDEPPTEVSIGHIETTSTTQAIYHDLSGRRTEAKAPGIYIRNGQKVWVK